MSDGGRPIGFAPVEAGAYDVGQEGERRVACLFLGSRIRREVELIHQATARLAAEGTSPSRMPDGRPIVAIEVEILQSRLNTAMRAARKTCSWDDGTEVGEDVRVLEAVRPPEENLTTLLETSERLLREFNETEDRAVAADPPLLRNVRRYAQSGPPKRAREGPE